MPDAARVRLPAYRRAPCVRRRIAQPAPSAPVVGTGGERAYRPRAALGNVHRRPGRGSGAA